MEFILNDDIMTKAGKHLTWVVAGIYPVVRYFDSNRVLVDTGRNDVRQLTVILLTKGTIRKK